MKLVSQHPARCLPVCAVVLVAFISKKKKKRERKKTDTFQFDVALLITSIAYKKKKQKKKSPFFLSAVYSPWKNLCIAQKQANAWLLITGALAAPRCRAEQPSEGSLGLPFTFVYKYKYARFLFSCGARHLFTFLVQCLTSAVSSFQPSSSFFFLYRKRKKSPVVLLSLQKKTSVCTLSSCTHHMFTATASPVGV